MLNEDRHLRNISFIKSADGSLRVSPLYDFGLSLLSDRDRYPSGQYKGIIKSQPFDLDFDRQVGIFDNPHITIDLDGLLDRLIDARENPDLYVGYGKEVDLRRAVKILIQRLEETEGKLWFRKV